MRPFAIARLLFAACCLPLLVAAQVDDTPRGAPDFPKSLVWLDDASPAPHTMKEYRGRVVLVDFWEYTCINCIRDFAVVKRWYAKYHPYGFEVIGVHFGEFQIGFEPANVRSAARRLRLPWPVVADVKGDLWNAYQSNSWPNRYLIDPGGTIVMNISGEGNNVAMEKQIRDMLAKKNPELKTVALDPDENAFTPECGIPTQETYVGKWHGRGSVENSGAYRGKAAEELHSPKPPSDGGVVLDGRWLGTQDSVINDDSQQKDRATLHYHARSVYAVLGTSNAKSNRVYLLQDGAPLPSRDRGRDVKLDDRGAYVDITEPRMYDLVRNSSDGPRLKNRLPEHLLTLAPESPGFKIYSFTYGNNCQQSFQ